MKEFMSESESQGGWSVLEKADADLPSGCETETVPEAEV